MNILLVYELKSNTTDVNISNLSKILGQVKSITLKVLGVQDIATNDLNWCDTIWIIRPQSAKSLFILKSFKKANKTSVAIYDDDLLHAKSSLLRNQIKKCLSNSHYLIGSNELVLTEYAQYTLSKQYQLIHYPVEKDDFLLPSQQQEQIQFVFAAGGNHEKPFELFIKPILDKLISQYPKAFHFTFIGVHPNLCGLSEEYFTYVPNMDYSDYCEYMKTHRFDIGLAPLEDNDFNNRKYKNKYIEYTKYGIFGLYSNIPLYATTIQDKKNGLLVNNYSNDWFNSLCFAIENIEQLKRQTKVAQELLIHTNSVEQNVQNLNRLISNINSMNTTSSISINSIQNKWFKCNFYLYRLIYNIENYGIRYTLSRVINTIKR